MSLTVLFNPRILLCRRANQQRRVTSLGAKELVDGRLWLGRDQRCSTTCVHVSSCGPKCRDSRDLGRVEGFKGVGRVE